MLVVSWVGGSGSGMEPEEPVAPSLSEAWLLPPGSIAVSSHEAARLLSCPH